jgi:outer membrane protein assembly factor BamB
MPLAARAQHAATPQRNEATAAGGATPTAWLGLRNGTDNSGVIGGSYLASWRFKAPHAVRGLSVADGVVMLGTESGDADGHARGPDQRGFVYALDATTGQQLWTAEVPSWVHGDPAIYRGIAYVTYGQYPIESPGGVRAFDLRSGKVLWTMPTFNGNMPAPAVDTLSQRLVVVGGDGVLYELSLTDGTPVSQTGLRAVVAMSSPRIGADRFVYFGAGRTLVRYSLASHALDWRVRMPPLLSLGDTPVALTDTAAFTSGYGNLSLFEAFRRLPFGRFWSLARTASDANAWNTRDRWFSEQWIAAIDRRDGRLLWKQSLGVGNYVSRNASGTPVTAGDAVIISSPFSKQIHVFDAATGRRRWERQLVDIHKGAVTVFDGEILVGDRKGALTAYDVNDGAVKGQCNAGAGFTVLAPVLVGRTLFLATRDGAVVAAPFDSVRARMTSKGKCS